MTMIERAAQAIVGARLCEPEISARWESDTVHDHIGTIASRPITWGKKAP